MQKGDFIAIYITAPTKAIRYLCQVLEANIANQGYRDEESIKELMRIKPLYSFNDSDFDSERLKCFGIKTVLGLSLIHISEPTRPRLISYAVFCLKKFFFNDTATTEIYTV